MAEPPVVLVVDDESGLADLYASWLGERYATTTAYGGQAALERLDESIDVVILDRRMPELSGDDVLAEITDRGLDCRVAIVTAVRPDFDVLGRGFDDYLTKPVSQGELRSLLEALVRRKQYDARMKELLSLLSRRATLRMEKSEAELRRNDAYQDLLDRIHDVKVAADDILDELGTSQTDVLFRRETDTLEKADD